MPNESGKQPLHKKHVARLERERQQSRWILYGFIGIVTTVALLIGYAILDNMYLRFRYPVAKVGEVQILAGDFEARARLQRQQLLYQYNQVVLTYNQYQEFAQSSGMDLSQQLQQFESQAQEIQRTLDDPESLGLSVLNQLTREELIRQEAKKRGITASKSEVDQMMEEFFGYYPKGTPTPSATPTQFNTPEIPAEAFDIVTITPTSLPTSEFTATPEIIAITAAVTDATIETGTPQATATVAAAPTGTLAPETTATQESTSTPEPTATPYTRESFDKNYGKQIELMSKLNISEDAFRSLLEIQILERKLKDVISADTASSEDQIWARHILVSDENAAKDVIKRLQKGDDFATLAIELSSDTGSGANGGDLGFFGKGAMVPEFEAAAYALKAGEYTTEPVKSEFGFHIIQVIAKQNRPLEPDKYQAARDTAFSDWVESAKKEYKVETFDIWKDYVPDEPNAITMATDAANQQLTALAEEKAAKKATETPIK